VRRDDTFDESRRPSGDIRGMRENRFPHAMRLACDRCGQIHWHDQNAIALNGTRKDFDAVRTIANLLPNSFDGLKAGFHIGYINVVGCQKTLYINWRSALRPERLTNGKNPGTTHLATLDPAPDECSVGQHGCNAKDELRSNLAESFSACSSPGVRMCT
jgi:hypothetical protein